MRAANPWLMALIGVAAMLAVACGGGGGGESGDGVRVTDPAAVPSSTRISNAVLYQIKDGNVIATGATAAAVLPTTNATQRAGQAQTHVVVAGDNCASIAEQYSITLPELLRANTFINGDCSNLRVDDQLRIPSAQGATSTQVPGSNTGGGGGSYTVVSGDTCAGIADANSVSLDELLAANPSIDSDCSNLKVDQVLKLP